MDTRLFSFLFFVGQWKNVYLCDEDFNLLWGHGNDITKLYIFLNN